jgi:hypothetical protein
MPCRYLVRRAQSQRVSEHGPARVAGLLCDSLVHRCSGLLEGSWPTIGRNARVSQRGSSPAQSLSRFGWERVAAQTELRGSALIGGSPLTLFKPASDWPSLRRKLCSSVRSRGLSFPVCGKPVTTRGAVKTCTPRQVLGLTCAPLEIEDLPDVVGGQGSLGGPSYRKPVRFISQVLGARPIGRMLRRKARTQS